MKHIELGLSLINNDYKHVLEFGVFQGRTITFIRQNLDLSYEVFGFDSFEGLPEDWKDSNGNFAHNSIGEIFTKGEFTNKGVIPNIENCKLYKGWFEDTIKEYLKIAKPISFLHIDCDLYSSTKTVLYNLNDHIKPNTIILFDEWIFNMDVTCNNHEQKCFYEWVNDFNRKFELIDMGDGVLYEQKLVRILE